MEPSAEKVCRTKLFYAITYVGVVVTMILAFHAMLQGFVLEGWQYGATTQYNNISTNYLVTSKYETAISDPPPGEFNNPPPGECNKPPPGESNISAPPDPAAILLYEQWQYLFIDPTNTSLPESERSLTMHDVGIEGKIPNAPHLQDCPTVIKLRAGRDELLENGKYPEWVDLREDGTPGDSPKPPWVRGSDWENVPLLRIVQRDLWLQQHPRDCSDPSVKFVIIDWPPTQGYGLGSQFHLMSTDIGKVWASGRVVVTAGWNNADHDGCAGSDRARLECYFLGLSSPECTQVALDELKRNPGMPYMPQENIFSDERFVRFGFWQGLELPQSLLEMWGGVSKWMSDTPTTEMGGRLTRFGEPKVYAKWWHSQTTAYMFRQPSKHLCRIVNRARHEVYGMEVAEDVVSSQRRRAELDGGQPLFSADAFGKPSVSLDTTAWLDEEPYIPRPLLSMHIRQGDKGSEMQIFQLRDVMWSAERIRLHVPNLKQVWLSTEMETVLEESVEYTPRWNFMYTKAHRMVGTKANSDYEVETGARAYVEHSLANLMIAAEADYFVGTLGSNWNRLLDEFRKTRGRIRRGYIAVNDEEY